ncbi:HAD family hydrolase [Candidatus Puniceispirillum sp.]|uniref:HAD family hydrolase n=1 Tax=Candidatus Puniceispirillum sp. TaxID=2026719 RepID=UPI003F698C84
MMRVNYMNTELPASHSARSKPIKLIIFDKDGVILDLAATWFPVVYAVAEYTISIIPDHGATTRATPTVGLDDLLAHIGVDAAGNIDHRGLFAAGTFTDICKAWQTLLPDNMIDLLTDTSYKARVNELVIELVRGRSVAKGDVKTPLTMLSKAGYILALLTNDNAASALQNLKDLEIDHLFATIIGADSGFGGKPAPQGLLHICDTHGVMPDQTIMVGDTIADYGVAINAKGQNFICVADDINYRPDTAIDPDLVIPGLESLPSLIETLPR